MNPNLPALFLVALGISLVFTAGQWPLIALVHCGWRGRRIAIVAAVVQFSAGCGALYLAKHLYNETL